MIRRFKSILVVSLVLCLLVTGCSSTSAPSSNQSAPSEPADRTIKDNLVVVLKGEPSNIDPHGNGELVAFTTQMQIYDTLVKKDSKGNVVHSVATSWEEIDDSTVRFHLRDDIYFHNGEKLTAEDVRFSIQRATEKPHSASIFSGFDGEKTKVVDDYTIDIATNGAFAGIYNYLCSTRGQIVCKSAVESMGDEEFGRNPVGSGPFVFESWATGTEIKLKRNEKYWGEKPKFSSMTLKFIPEAATRAIEIESGNADVVFDVSASDVPRLSSNSDLNVISDFSYGLSYIVYNMKDPVFSDARLRKALSLAIEKSGLVKAVYGDLATVAESVIPKTVFSYEPQNTNEYNVELAKQLLAEAGYSDGLNVSLCVPDTQEAKDIAEIVQNMWSQIGVNTEIKVSAMSEFLAAGRRGQNQISITAANYTTGDPGHALADFDTRTNSWFCANDTKIDEYLDKGMATYDTTERSKVYQELQKYIAENYYMIPVANKMVTYITTKNIENFYCDPGNSPYLGNVIPYEK